MTERTSLPRIDNRGLDFNDLSGITPEEVQTFRESYRTEDGSPQSGFDFLIEHNPAALKTYRYFASQVQAPYGHARYQAPAFGGLGYYGLLGFDEGIRYIVVPLLRAGFTKAQIDEGMALAFMVGGTYALVTIGRALKDFTWPMDRGSGPEWPEGWGPDPAAFASGVDFSTLQVRPGDVDKIVGWYERTIDWVPNWVRFYARHNPGALKGWRYRYEKAMVTLPKQILPLSLLFGGARLEQRETIRENVLVARAFGVSIEDVVQTIGVTAVYGTEKVSVVQEAAGDVLESWAAE